jgi:hypothetical protein
VRAAVSCRLQDLADLPKAAVEAVPTSRELSGLFVLVPALYVSVLFIRHGGWYGLAEHPEDVAVVWGAAYGLIRAGRQWLDVKPSERKPRRKNESSGSGQLLVSLFKPRHDADHAGSNVLLRMTFTLGLCSRCHLAADCYTSL